MIDKVFSRIPILEDFPSQGKSWIISAKDEQLSLIAYPRLEFSELIIEVWLLRLFEIIL